MCKLINSYEQWLKFAKISQRRVICTMMQIINAIVTIKEIQLQAILQKKLRVPQYLLSPLN